MNTTQKYFLGVKNNSTDFTPCDNKNARIVLHLHALILKDNTCMQMKSTSELRYILTKSWINSI